MMWRPLALSRLPVGSSARTIDGLVRERPRQRDALLFAAGELRGIVMRAAGESDLFEQSFGTRSGVGAPAISIGTATFS